MTNSGKQFFLSADLNDLMEDSRFLPLRNQKSIEILRKEYTNIVDGLKIWLFAPTFNHGKFDPTIFPGIIKDLGKLDEYKIMVDEKEMKYLSGSEMFNKYSIENIIGNEWYNSIKKEHPEWL